MRLRIAIPEEHVNPAVIDAGLEAVTRLDEQLIRAGKVPLFDDALIAGRVRWQPEPPGQEHFDHAGIVLARGWGDCDDVAPYAAASERVTGRDPGAVARIVRSGPTTWHAIVDRSDGSRRDPSIEAGMGSRGRVSGDDECIIGIDAPLIAPMFGPGRGPSVALASHHGGMVEARADLPMRPGSGYSYSATVLGYDAAGVLHGAVVGVCEVGVVSGLVDPNDVAALCVTDMIAAGATPRAALLGLAQVGACIDADVFHRACSVGERVREMREMSFRGGL